MNILNEIQLRTNDDSVTGTISENKDETHFIKMINGNKQIVDDVHRYIRKYEDKVQR